MSPHFTALLAPPCSTLNHTSVALERVCRIPLLFPPKFVCVYQVFAANRVPVAKPINTKMSSSPAFESIHPVRDDSPDLPSNRPNLVEDHPPVISRLRPRKRPNPPTLPSTPKRRKPTKRARQGRNDSSPNLAPSSPYRLLNAQFIPGFSLVESSPYRFDEEFYHQGSILNGDIDIDAATYGAVNNRHKKHLCSAHERIIDSAKLEEFSPINMPNPPRPMRSHLSNSADVKDPASFFDMFLKDDDFDMIAMNTNKYAESYAGRYQKAGQKVFKPTTRDEIKVYFAILIYLGIHQHHNPKLAWDNMPRNTPCQHMSWSRYELLKARLKVSDIDDDDKHADVPGDWHFKISPLDERLMERFQDAVTPGSNVSYDEQMLPFRGRSAHVTKVPGKPHPDGFKVWALCDDGYIFDWLYYSGTAGMFCVFIMGVAIDVKPWKLVFEQKSSDYDERQGCGASPKTA
jgi:Transposase IS4